MLSLDSILKAGKDKIVQTPDLRVKPPKAPIPKPAPNVNKEQNENDGPVRPMGDMSRLKAASQTQVLPMSNSKNISYVKEPKFVSPAKDLGEDLTPLVNILMAAQNANVNQAEQISSIIPHLGATVTDIHRALFPSTTAVTGTIEPNQFQDVVNVFSMYDPNFQAKADAQFGPVVSLPFKNHSRTPVKQGLYSYNLGDKFRDLLSFGDVKSQITLSYKQLIAGITNVPSEIAAGLISEADKLKKSLVVAPISKLTSKFNSFIKNAPQKLLQGAANFARDQLFGSTLPVKPEGVPNGLIVGLVTQGIKKAKEQALAAVSKLNPFASLSASAISGVGRESDGKENYDKKKEKFGIRWGVGSLDDFAQEQALYGDGKTAYNENRLMDSNLAGSRPMFKGPNFRGYDDADKFNARVDRYYDFRIEAPYYLYKYHGLPLPIRQTDRQWPGTSHHYVQSIEAFLGSEYKKGSSPRPTQDADWSAGKDLLLISNLAEMATVEIGSGEQFDLGLFGQTALTKRIDQIARITTFIIEDDNHSVRKWLEAYKNYLYGPSPNPYLHRPIYLAYYRIYFWLLNYDKSIAYRRCFWGVPNYNLAMTPNEDGIREFAVQWDIIGEDVPATTAYITNEQALVKEYSSKTLQVTSPISGTYHDSGHPDSGGVNHL